MVRLALLAVSLWPAVLPAESPGPMRSPSELAGLCAPAAPAGQTRECRAYLEGVYDTVELFADFGLIDREICPPPGLDSATLHEIVLAKMRLDAAPLVTGDGTEPDDVDYTRRVAAALAIVAWVQALPCR